MESLFLFLLFLHILIEIKKQEEKIMKITRTICGEELVITLTNKELNEAYQVQKRILDINEVRDALCELEFGGILR